MPQFETVAIDRTEPLCGTLAGQQRIGLDTEFMREKTYFPQLCLIQVAIGHDLYCIDPLPANPAPERFWPSLLTPTWVLHSGRQDLEVVYLSAGRLPEAVFDTQIAAALLGYAPQMGYANLVAELFDVRLEKSQTRADWSRRPLAPAALEYAAEDVEHLLPAWQVLHERLDDCGRLQWAAEDSADLLDPALYRSDAADAVDRLKGARRLRGRARRAAANLAGWRERQAEQSDRPRQWIMRDATMLDIATGDPTTRQALAAVPGVPAATARRAGDELLGILGDARDSRDDYEPPARPDEAQKALLKTMQKKVTSCAGELGIATEVVAPRKDLSSVLSGDRSVRVLRGWRRELIGNDLLRLLDS